MYEEFILFLTDKDSHKVSIEVGRGDFLIGTENISSGKFDVLVKENSVINWDTFNGFYVPGWSHIKEKSPYGNWPRFFKYSGNDKGFIEWSKKRKIEDFYWLPQTDVVADFTDSNINSLSLESNHKIECSLGEKIIRLKLYGKLENYLIKECKKVPSLTFEPKYNQNITLYRLPIYNVLKDAKELHIHMDPNKPPLDCTSLLQFPNLEELYLVGNMTNLHALKDLKSLIKIGLWDMPNLSNMPNLNTWSNLNSLIAVNIEETVGKKLRKELNELKKMKKMEYSTVSKLRDMRWFEINYGIPFSNWEEKNEKKATNAYKKCLKSVNDAKTEMDIKKLSLILLEK